MILCAICNCELVYELWLSPIFSKDSPKEKTCEKCFMWITEFLFRRQERSVWTVLSELTVSIES